MILDMQLLEGHEAARDAIGAQNKFFAQICQVPIEVFQRMDTKDYRRFTRFLGVFTKEDPEDEEN